MRIDSISPEQAARFGEWAEKWVAIGLSTEPADFDAATEAALKAYRLCNLDRPTVVLRLGSPYAATVGGALAWAILREVLPQVRSQVESQVESQVGSQVESQVESQVWSQVLPLVRSQVWSQVESLVWSLVTHGLNNDRGGSFWASWGAYVSFIRDVLGWQNPVLECFEIDEALIKSCGWVWWHEDVCAISDRPAEIHRDEQGRLHNEIGPAVLYRDGWSLWSWHGVTVSEKIITKPQSITVRKIQKEENAEVRRAMIEIFGYERYIKKAGMVLVSEDKDILQNPRKLWRKDIGDEWPLTLVDVINSSPEPDGSFRRYILSVPPEDDSGNPIRTPHEAIAWTWGMSPEEYWTTVET